uniref:Uncharacterized protein n=1 Tax=Lepeophtheirus salmonis TaxID=72036 RepID=A0A0K2V449_LEPSM
MDGCHLIEWKYHSLCRRPNLLLHHPLVQIHIRLSISCV